METFEVKGIEYPLNQYNKWALDTFDFIQEKINLSNEVKQELMEWFYNLE